MSNHSLILAASSSINTSGLVSYLQGLFGPLFLGIVGIVALFFLFTREIIRFVQFLVLAVAIAVIFYTPSIVQTRATGIANALGLPFSHTLFWLYVLPPGVLTWLATRPVLESKRLPELVISQVRYLGEPTTWCRMNPLAEAAAVRLCLAPVDDHREARYRHRQPSRARSRLGHLYACVCPRGLRSP